MRLSVTSIHFTMVGRLRLFMAKMNLILFPLMTTLSGLRFILIIQPRKPNRGETLNKLPTVVYRLITFDKWVDKPSSIFKNKPSLINLFTANLKLSLHHYKGSTCGTEANGGNVEYQRLILPEASFRLQVPSII